MEELCPARLEDENYYHFLGYEDKKNAAGKKAIHINCVCAGTSF